MPNWEAYSALAYVSGQRARAPFAGIEKTRGKLVFVDIKHAKLAAGFYDKAAALMPDVRSPLLPLPSLPSLLPFSLLLISSPNSHIAPQDAHQKGQLLWYALDTYVLSSPPLLDTAISSP
jgi:hypothetical protein